MFNFWTSLGKKLSASFEEAEERFAKKTMPLLCGDVQTVMAKEREKLNEVVPLDPRLIQVINQCLLNPKGWLGDDIVRVPKWALSFAYSNDCAIKANLASIRFAYDSWHVDENDYYFVFTAGTMSRKPPPPPTGGKGSEFC